MSNNGSTKVKRAGTRFGGNLKLARLARGLDRMTVAKASGVPWSSVRSIEAGAFRPTWEVAKKLAAGVGVGVKTLEDSDLADRVREVFGE